MTPDDLDLAADALTIVADERRDGEAEGRLAARLRGLAATLRATPSGGSDLDELMAELHFAIDQQLALISALKNIRDERQDMWDLQETARQALLDHYARSEQRVKDLEDSGRYS